MNKSTEARQRRRRARRYELLHGALDHAIFLLSAAVICGTIALLLKLLVSGTE